jgi:hypothetical protein
MQVHQAYAIKQIFQDFQQKANFSIFNLEIMNYINKLSSFEISRLGILNVNSESDFTFVHQTFAEFFVARFLIENFEHFDFENKKSDSDLKIYLLNLVLFSRRFEFSKNILLSYAKIKNEIPKLFKVLRKDEDFYEVLQKFSTYKNFKKNFIKSENIKSVNVLEKFHDIKNEVEKFFDENLRKILTSKNNGGVTLLHEIFYDANENLIESFLEKTQKVLNQTEITSLIFAQESEFNETSLMVAAKWRKLKDLIFFWNFLDKNLNEDEKVKILLVEQKASSTALQYSTENEDPNSFLFMKEIYEKFFTQEKIQEIFLKNKRGDFSFVQNVINFASYENALKVSKYLENLFENEKIKLRTLITHKSECGISIFSFFKNKKNLVEKVKIFVKLLRNTFNDNNEKNYEENYKIYQSDFKGLMKASKSVGNFDSYESFQNPRWSSNDLEFYSFFFNEIKQKSDTESIKECLLHDNELDLRN